MSEIKLEETPTLTFEPFKEEPQLPVEEPQKQMAEAASALDDSMLSDEEKQMVKDFARRSILPIQPRCCSMVPVHSRK